MKSGTRVRRLLPSLCAAGALLTFAAVGDARCEEAPLAADPMRAGDPPRTAGAPPGAESPPDGASLRGIAARIAPSVVLLAGQTDADNVQGSGFIVDARGVIVTALHVIDGAKRLTVTLADGRQLENPGVRAFNVENDLAVILAHVPAGGGEIAAAVLGKPATAEPGDPILVVSNPMGFKQTVTEGIVSAWRERTPEEEPADDRGESKRRLLPSCRLLQISAAISPGSSGGPVADQRGEVIGVATAGVLYGLASLNFAVPVSELSPLLKAEGVMDLATFQSRLNATRRDLARPHFESALVALDQGRRPEAKRRLERALLLFPGYEEALLLSARLLTEDGDLEGALERVTDAIKAREESAEAWYWLGRVNERMARERSDPALLARARTAYDRALGLDPRHAGAALGLAVLQMRQGSLTQAEELLRRAIAEQPDLADAHYALGLIYARKMLMTEAEEAFKKALWADPDHVLGHFSLAQLYTARGPAYLDFARDHWRDFLRLAKDDPSYADEIDIAHRTIEQYFPQMVDW